MSVPHSLESNAVYTAEELNVQGRYPEALAAAEHALHICPEDTDARFAQAFALLLLNRREEAAAALDCLLAAAPAYPNAAWMQAGLLRSLHGDHDPRILSAYDRVLCLEPTNLYALSERADVLRTQGRYAEAQEVYARLRTPEVCPEEPLRIEATFQFGCVAMVLNRPDEAREAFRAVLDAAPDYPDACDMYALVGGI